MESDEQNKHAPIPIKDERLTPELEEAIRKDAEPIMELANELFKKYYPHIIGVEQRKLLNQDKNGSLDQSGLYTYVKTTGKYPICVGELLVDDFPDA